MCSSFVISSNKSPCYTVLGIVTSQHKHCKIPWKIEEDGPELYTCTSSRSPSGETDDPMANSWCATTVNNDLTYKEWDWCSGKIFLPN